MMKKLVNRELEKGTSPPTSRCSLTAKASQNKLLALLDGFHLCFSQRIFLANSVAVQAL
jgi:hypothetical protein